MYLFFNVYSSPVPQPRPKVTRKLRVYYPGPINAFKTDVYVAAQREMFYTNQDRVDNKPVYVSIAFVKSAKSPIAPRFGDIDNLAKGVLDAMNGLVYADDRQVVGAHFFKACTKGDKEWVDVFVTDGIKDYLEYLREYSTKYIQPLADNKLCLHPRNFIVDEPERCHSDID